MSHQCHAIGCSAAVTPKMLMCRKHWFIVPSVLRSLIWKHYRPGQELDKSPSPKYLEIQRAAIDAVAYREGKLRRRQTVLEELRSGGQEGVDFAGLLVGAVLGFKTGGIAPKGWKILLPNGSTSSNPRLASFGLVQHDSPEYRSRTIQNVLDADGTLWVGFTESPGGKLTLNTCRSRGKPHVINPTPDELRQWAEDEGIKIVNVAGNRESDINPGIGRRAYDCIIAAFGVWV